MSGVYNETYFSTRPEEREREGVLYGVVSVSYTHLRAHET